MTFFHCATIIPTKIKTTNPCISKGWNDSSHPPELFLAFSSIVVVMGLNVMPSIRFLQSTLQKMQLQHPKMVVDKQERWQLLPLAPPFPYFDLSGNEGELGLFQFNWHVSGTCSRRRWLHIFYHSRQCHSKWCNFVDIHAKFLFRSHLNSYWQCSGKMKTIWIIAAINHNIRSKKQQMIKTLIEWRLGNWKISQCFRG